MPLLSGSTRPHAGKSRVSEEHSPAIEVKDGERERVRVRVLLADRGRNERKRAENTQNVGQRKAVEQLRNSDEEQWSDEVK